MLFFYGGAMDIKPLSNHAKLMEFYKLDKEIDELQNKLLNKWLSAKKKDNVPCPFNNLELTLMKARAKMILRHLNLI